MLSPHLTRLCREPIILPTNMVIFSLTSTKIIVRVQPNRSHRSIDWNVGFLETLSTNKGWFPQSCAVTLFFFDSSKQQKTLSDKQAVPRWTSDAQQRMNQSQKLNRWSKDTRTPQERDCRNLLTVSSSTIAQV